MRLLDRFSVATAPCLCQSLKNPLFGSRRSGGFSDLIVRAHRVKSIMARRTELVQNNPLRDAGEFVKGVHEFGRLCLEGPKQQIVDPAHESEIPLASRFDRSEERNPIFSAQVSHQTFSLC